MANLSLSQLREAQKAYPPSVEDEKIVKMVNPAWITAPGRFPGLEPDAFKPLNIGPPPGAAGPTTAASLPLQASAPVPAVPGGGYCRIFPPTFPSIGAIPQVWKDENWTGPSPWCHVEGAPQHPDFESNLRDIEQAL